jgi:hypothetical protein
MAQLVVPMGIIVELIASKLKASYLMGGGNAHM